MQEALARQFSAEGMSTAIIGFKGGREYIKSYAPGSCLGSVLEDCFKTLLPHLIAIEELKENSDPVEFENSFVQVLKNQNISLADLFNGNELESVTLVHRRYLEGMVKDYKQLKGTMLGLYRAKGRDFKLLKVMKESNPAAVLEIILQSKQAGGDSIARYEIFVRHCLAKELIMVSGYRESGEAENLNDRVDELNREKRHAEALECSDNALALSPKFCLAYINRGIALKNLGRFDEAIACYDKVINEINPNSKKAWYNKAVALFNKGEIGKVKECVDRALQIAPYYQPALKLKMQLG